MTEMNIPTMGTPGIDGGPTGEMQPTSNMDPPGQDPGRLQNHFDATATDARQVAGSGEAAAKETGRITVRTARTNGTLATAAFRGRLVIHPGMALGIPVGAGILIGPVAPANPSLKRNPS